MESILNFIGATVFVLLILVFSMQFILFNWVKQRIKIDLRKHNGK